MANLQRLEFITRHFKDLQTIRCAPLPIAMLLAPAVPDPGGWHMSRSTAWVVLMTILLTVIGFYWWATVAIRPYGSVRLSGKEGLRMRMHPIILGLFMVMFLAQTWFYFFRPRTHYWDVYTLFTVLIIMLQPIFDSTNPASRRIAWAIGLVVLFSVGPLLYGVNRDLAFSPLAGGVWLSLSMFDFLLLRRTFAEISASPSSGATEAVANFG
jgi:hypothetical protein